MHAQGMGWNVILSLLEDPMSKTKRPAPLDNLAVVHPNAAGLDIGRGRYGPVFLLAETWKR